MERERRKRIRIIKLAITEVVMVIAIIILVILLTLLAMGYNVNRKGEVGQQGLAQINSRPTGAMINIDEEDLLARTNTSKLLSAGSHTIKITKENYDSWEKVVTIESGRLLKIDYVRLFWQGRTPERMREYKDTELAFFEPAPNHDSIIYAAKNENVWNWLDIRGDNAVDNYLDFKDILGDLKIEQVDWNGDSDKVLVRARNADDQSEWFLLNLRDVKKSINLTKEFGLSFQKIIFMTNNGDKMLSLSGDGDLRMVSVSDKTVSQIIAADVDNYAINDNNLFYVTNDKEVFLHKGGADDDIQIAKFEPSQKVKIDIFDYLGEKYLSLIVDQHLYIYKGDYPNSERKLDEMDLVCDKELKIVPLTVKMEANGELLVAKNGRSVAVFDAELNNLHEFELEGEQLFFIDFYLMGTIVEGKLVIYDFDGTNRRELTEATGTALITKNEKWMYYLRVQDNNSNIYREQIIE